MHAVFGLRSTVFDYGLRTTDYVPSSLVGLCQRQFNGPAEWVPALRGAQTRGSTTLQRCFAWRSQSTVFGAAPQTVDCRPQTDDEKEPCPCNESW